MGTSFTERGLALLHNGYHLIPIPEGTKAPKEDAWQKIVATEAKVRKWGANGYKRGNIGILTRTTPGIDNDITHTQFAEEMQDVIVQIVGSSWVMPTRVGQAPKKLGLCIATTPFRKLEQIAVDPAGKRHKIEILGDGQQFVAYGVHPDTHRQFEWITPENPMNTPIDELPSLCRAQGLEILAEFATRCEKRGWQVGTRPAPNDDDGLGGFEIRSRIHISVESVREDLKLVAGFDEYDKWTQVGMALHHQFDGDEQGFELWDEWSSQATGVNARGEPVYDPEALRQKWHSRNAFRDVRSGGRGPITYRSIRKEANEARAKAVEVRRAKEMEIAQEIGEGKPEPRATPKLSPVEMINRLVYVAAQNCVADKRTGRVRKLEQARVEFSASKEVIHGPKGGVTIVKHLEEWLASSSRETVDVVAWRPDRGEICEPPEIDGNNSRAFNTWRGLRPLRVPERWREISQVFVDHVKYLVPVEHERERFLDWLAHIVQFPGVLPHTYYLFFTQTKGTGRNWLGCLLARVLPGNMAAGVAPEALMGGGFNGRLSQKLLATIDEIRIGSAQDRRDQQTAIDSHITEEVRHLDPKYGVQSVEKNCLRWMLFSNYLDAVPFENDDRRAVVIANPTTPRPPDYYERLYAMLAKPALPCAVREFLRTRDLSRFNPGERAPMNEIKMRALSAMASPIDDAVRAFKEEWPGLVAGRSDLKNYVMQHIGGGHQLNEKALTFAIGRAGMEAGPQVGQRRDGTRDHVIAMRVGLIAGCHGSLLLSKMKEARDLWQKKSADDCF